MKIRHIILLIFVALLSACTPTPKDVQIADVYPCIYPDYIDVTIPVNIAPLNFLARNDCDAMQVIASCGDKSLKANCNGPEATFSEKKWRDLLASARNSHITVTVTARYDGKWTQYKPFNIYVSSDSIDPYLTYRLIEPDYEVFSRLQIKERNVENFDERVLCDYNTVGNRCMNCHTYGANRPDLSFLYVRGEGGGMILNENGKLRKLALKSDDMVSGSVYAQFSPSGRYLVFSSNVIIPGFHSDPSKRLEVFDTKSDIYVADLQSNRIIRSPLLADSTKLETFPTFSPDGKYIYFCTADGPGLPKNVENLQYNLCRIGFEEASGTFGTEIDTVLVALPGEKGSVCHPRVSPDGKYILYSVADYGTFPIWHTESDLRMLDLKTGQINTLDDVNSDKSDTYHSWSADGKWFVFASKRDDGLYGKPYFCHVNADGSVTRPFVLPQKYPTFYDHNLKSFNVPELGKAPVKFDAFDVADAMKADAESFR